jgi:hypothetical protein
MSRPAFCSLLVFLMLAPGVGLPARAQDDDGGPLDAKDTARRLRQGQQAEPRSLTRALRDAARSAYDVRFQGVLGGTETPDRLLDELRRLLPAEWALADGPAGRVAAWQRYWAGAREFEELTRERVEERVRGFSSADYWAARYERLMAEASLLEELRRAGQPLAGTFSGALGDPDPGAAGLVARDAFRMSRAAPRESARAAHDACEREYEVRIQRIAAGTDTPDVTLAILPRRYAAAQAAGAGPAELLATREALLQMAWYCEVLIAERNEAGVKMFTPADYYDALDRRVEAGVLVAEDRRQGGRTRPLVGGLQDVIGALDDPLDTKRLARAKSDAARADPRRLVEGRREALLAAFATRLQRIRAGTDTPDVTIELSRRLLAVELKLAAGPAERRAARERHWARALEIEVLTADRVSAGIKAFTPADYYEAQYERLLAELQMAQARAKE